MATDMNVQELLVIGDSDLLIHQNEFADALATLSSMIQHPDKNFIDPIPVKIHDQPTYFAHIEEEADGKPWFHDIKKYLVYHTTVRTSTRATPYMLVYGKEVVIPVEVEIPSLMIIQEVELDDAEWVKSRCEQVALIDGKRINVICHGQLYQNRMSRAFNKRVKLRQFTPGQLVLKKMFSHQDEAKGKFSPNLQGPYNVHRVLTGGALILAETDGEV
ncbi:uncharacterized protein [Nicotiana sylvestris]|uniref:uncharacterized protein n=1 Tax=Nicotiana sylvestris TaxID=4096 RepID=UPI00388C3D65